MRLRTLSNCAFALSLPLSGVAMGASVVDREGIELGLLLSSNRNGEVSLLTSEGFLAQVSSENGSLQGPDASGETVYLDSSCTGAKYVRNVPIRPYVFRKGMDVLYVGHDSPIMLSPGTSYYIWAQIPPIPFPACHEVQITPSSGINFVDPWRLNDHEVTGIGSGPFKAPLRISVWSGYGDGFEVRS